jgi:hypothetical protein
VAAADGAGRSPARLTVPPSPGVSAPDEVEPLPLDVLAGSPDGLEAAVASAVESPDDPGDPDGPEAPVDVAPPDGEVPVTGEEWPIAVVEVAGRWVESVASAALAADVCAAPIVSPWLLALPGAFGARDGGMEVVRLGGRVLIAAVWVGMECWMLGPPLGVVDG